MSKKAVEILDLVPYFNNEGDISSTIGHEDDEGQTESLAKAKIRVQENYIPPLIENVEEYLKLLNEFKADLKTMSFKKLKEKYS